MPTWFKIGPLTVELVGLCWTIGIFGPLAGLKYWWIKSGQDTTRSARAILALLLALAFTPMLLPGYGGNAYDHVVPATPILVFSGLGLMSRWTYAAVALVSLLVSFCLIYWARRFFR